MTKHQLFIVLIIGLTINISFSQNKQKKTYTKEEMAQFETDYKIKKKKDKVTRKGLEGKLLPELNLKDINGNTYTLDSMKGKVVVMNFWFINCKPCVAEIPDLNTLKAQFKDKDVLFFAIALDNKKSLDKFLKNTTFDFNIIPSGGSLARQFRIPHYPYNVILSKEGRLEYVSDVLSFNIINRLKRKINGLLKN
ncbi:peroxiredoxin [uncultured Psychroserpens sp.]|uniref:peroxiredoxin family protein n=1 Tax=uncultured Psychroserpens sp. TaxID=255436 RepID=UPI0026109D70|nr:TlpA disulfide reductase family protein [uncultured Psychroserpens sp.]